MSLCRFFWLGCLTCNIFVENVVFFRNIVQNPSTALVHHKDFPFLSSMLSVLLVVLGFGAYIMPSCLSNRLQKY